MSSSDSNSSHEEALSGTDEVRALSQIPGWKRTFDVACVLATAPIWVPLGVVIAIAVKVASPGPMLFRQERVGHMGRRFLCLKFRSMKVNADTGVHRDHLTELMTRNTAMKKLDAADKRLIPGGLLLRTMGLDELPQLINVLRGEMSLVGPRPSLPYEYEKFEPRHRRRCYTLPGLTGLWQVSGKNRLTFERMMELDFEYVKKKSLAMDVKIVACTVPAILIQAYDVRQGRKTISHASGVERGRNGASQSEGKAAGGASILGKSSSTTGSRLVVSPRVGL